MKNILILHTSIGLGHKYIALNMAYHLERAGYNVLVHDILDVQKGWLVDLGAWAHSFVNRRLPFVWRWLYFSNLVNLIALPLRVPLAKANSEKLSSVVNKFQPDLIISTQTTGSAAVVALMRKGLYKGKFVIGFSDFHFHKFWLYKDANMFLVNIPEQKQELISLGVPESKIEVIGITLQPLEPTNEIELRKEFSIPENDRIVLIGSGSLGIAFPENVLIRFLRMMSQQPNLSTVVLCGKNEELRQRLTKLQLHNLKALPFTDKARQLYQIADLFLSKPGGLTTSEALQADTKVLITHTLPGQEEPNYDYLIHHNLVFSKPEPLTAENLVRVSLDVLSKPETSGETPTKQLITQKGHEGELLISAINKLFHNV